MRIAIIGSGIAGLTCAHLLSRRHAVTVFEAADRVGGHTHTVDVHWRGQQYAVDTGSLSSTTGPTRSSSACCNTWASARG